MTLIGKLMIENIVIIYFIYGLAFFTFGIAVYLSSLRPTTLKFANYLPWLAAYGFAHGLHEWLEMFVLIEQYEPLATNQLFLAFNTFLLVGSPLLLFIFGIGLLMTINERFERLKILPLVFYSAWAISAVSYLRPGAFDFQQFLVISDVLSRYLLIFPGALIAGFALFSQYELFSKQGFGITSKSLLVAAVALWLMALLSGLIVPYAPFFPASIINNPSFLSLTGFPIQIFRAVIAFLIAFGIVRSMHVFNIEEEKQEQRHRIELSTLDNISLDIRRDPDLASALNRAIREITKLFDVKAGAIFLVSEKTEKPDVVSEYGFVPGFAEKYKVMPEESLQTCQVRQVIKSQKPFITSNRVECPFIVESIAEPQEINAVVVLPLMAKEQTIGAIALLFESTEALQPSNVEILSIFAGNIGLAIENARLDEHHHAALLLQRSLLPEVPALQGIEIGVYYESASAGMQVGGDFYDFMRLSDDLLGIVIGDVAGSGIRAASTVAMAKYALEVFAFENRAPSVVMNKLNDFACRMLPPGQFVTAFYGVLDIRSGLFVFSSAGHLPPFVINEKTKEVIRLEGARGIALGIALGHKYLEEEVYIDPGGMFVSYTDGLIEARHNREFWGEERLISIVKEHYDLPAQVLVDKICNSAKEFAGGILADDVASVVVRRTFA